MAVSFFIKKSCYTLETIITILLNIVAIYVLIGFLFALFFITKGVTLIDKGAKDTSIGFRLLILPGSVALWPVLLKNYLEQRK